MSAGCVLLGAQKSISRKSYKKVRLEPERFSIKYLKHVQLFSTDHFHYRYLLMYEHVAGTS